MKVVLYANKQMLGYSLELARVDLGSLSLSTLRCYSSYGKMCNSGLNQLWVYDSSTKQIKSAQKSSKCLDVDYGNGFNLVVGNCHSGSNQKFYYEQEALKVYVDGSSVRCLDINYHSNDNVYAHNHCHLEDNQEYYFHKPASSCQI